MFTGLISILGSAKRQDSILTIYSTNSVLYQNPELKVGDSVAVNGVCLTVKDLVHGESVSFFVMQETLRKTNLGLKEYFPVNIERCLRSSDLMEGHVIQGHVHETGKVSSLSYNSDMSLDVWITSPSRRAIYKDSVAIQGVSLTIAEVSPDSQKFKVCLIPQTQTLSTLGSVLSVEDTDVNIEYNTFSPKTLDFMQEAIQEGNKARSLRLSNPWVGVVIAHQGQIVGRGHTTPEAHAEVNAINSVPNPGILSEAVLYTTLEPCVDFPGKRTPPCVEAIILAGISKVVIGILDPNSKVRGKGVESLQEHQIQVEVVDDPRVRKSLRAYEYFVTQKKTYFVGKIALTLDGCFARKDQPRTQITSNESQEDAHFLRASSQAILVGAKTVVSDNPFLTCRYPGKSFQPLRVVLDPRGILATGNYHVFSKDAPTLIYTQLEKYPRDDVQTVKIKTFEDVALDLARRNVIQCLVEGGNRLHSFLLDQDYLSEFYIYRSNLIFGDQGRLFEWSPKFGQFQLESVTKFGDEIRSHYLLSSKSSIENQLPQALEDLRQGKPVILMDHQDRENEGDLVIAAEFITPKWVTFLKNHTSGILCVTMERDRAAKLNLPLLRKSFQNEDVNCTPFTISCDARECKTGVSSEERCLTISKLADQTSKPEDFCRPGHVFPLVASLGGIFERKGHTEGSIELCKLAGIKPVAVIGELTNLDGTMMRLPDCLEFGKLHQIPVVTMTQLEEHLRQTSGVRAIASCEIQIRDQGEWELVSFGKPSENYQGGNFYPHKVLIKGNIYDGQPVLTRVHSECFTGDVLGSMMCDCGEQLELAKKLITERGSGMIIFPSRHEGRGIGLTDKLRAYRIMRNSQGKINTYQANQLLGHLPDARDYSVVRTILEQLKVQSIILLSNNPQKESELQNYVSSVLPLKISPNLYNQDYISAKQELFEKLSQVQEQLQVPKLEKDLKVGMISTIWNKELFENHILEIKAEFEALVSRELTFDDHVVPGAFEIPYKIKKLLQTQEYDVIICIGAVIKGETAHFDFISKACIEGMMFFQVDGDIPIINGVLNTYSKEQAVERFNSKDLAVSLARSAVSML